MGYSQREIEQFIGEEDVKFIRLAFSDVRGNQKNISVMPGELERAFHYGIAFDASSVDGFGGEVRSDLFLHPDLSTLSILPWRPDHGRVVRMYCDIKKPDGTPSEADTRRLLKDTVRQAEASGLEFRFGSEMEFYLFMLDQDGRRGEIPHDEAGYMDISPEDKGENVRREICLTLEQMGIVPESSHHEAGPGQNEIDFRCSDPVSAADNAVTFRSVVSTIAARNGLYADFSPKPMRNCPGNGMHINISVRRRGTGEEIRGAEAQMIAGIMEQISGMTVFLNRTEASYDRLGCCKAPEYISWSPENRSGLIRVPAAFGEHRRVELRSPDPLCNPYLCYALIIRAAQYGIERGLVPAPPVDMNFSELSGDSRNSQDSLDSQDLLDSRNSLDSMNSLDSRDSLDSRNSRERFKRLPRNLREARSAALASEFNAEYVPKNIIDFYCSEA